jgi:hypothetical protein
MSTIDLTPPFNLELSDQHHAPEFGEFNADAVDAAVRCGATVVRNWLSPESLIWLQHVQGGLGNSYAEHRMFVPELADLHTLFDASHALYQRSPRGVSAHDPEEIVWSHTDEPVLPGLTVIAPVTGAPAVIMANALPFTQYDYASVDYANTYGPGDAAIIREDLLYYEGEKVHLPAVEHLGFGPTDRILAIYDVITPIINLPNA